MGLDAVELVMAFEEGFGISIPDEDAARMRTPRSVLDYAAARLGPVRGDGCLTQRTFYALRRGFRAAGTVDAPLRPGTPLRALGDRASWPVVWTRVRLGAGQPAWPASVRWRGFLGGGPSTLGELTRHLATRPPPPGERWTFERMELVLRAALHDAGIDDFSLDDDFVRDLKLD